MDPGDEGVVRVAFVAGMATAGARIGTAAESGAARIFGGAGGLCAPRGASRGLAPSPGPLALACGAAPGARELLGSRTGVLAARRGEEGRLDELRGEARGEEARGELPRGDGPRGELRWCIGARAGAWRY